MAIWSQRGRGGGAVALWEGERPPTSSSPLGPALPASAARPQQSSLEAPWTDSHPRGHRHSFDSTPLTAPQIQTSALMWRLPTGLIETRPPGPQPPSVSPNGDWLLLHPHGVPLIRTSLLPCGDQRPPASHQLATTLPSGFQLGLEARWGTPCQPSRPSEREALPEDFLFPEATDPLGRASTYTLSPPTKTHNCPAIRR